MQLPHLLSCPPPVEPLSPDLQVLLPLVPDRITEGQGPHFSLLPVPPVSRRASTSLIHLGTANQQGLCAALRPGSH